MTTERAAPQDDASNRLFRLLIGVYLGGGLLNSMINLLVPRLQITMGLSYAQALWVQFAYYSSYLLFALPITLCSVRLGYMRSIATGLAVMGAGCLAFAAAQGRGDYPLLLGALLLMSSGVTFLQISGNAITTAFGVSTGMASRLTLLQAFNSLGTVLGPLVGAWFLLGSSRNATVPGIPFVLSAIGLLVLSIAFLVGRGWLPVLKPAGPPWQRLRGLAVQPRMVAGAAAIFAYVGVEVTIGTLAVAYLMRADTIGVGAVTAGRLVSVYWAAAMIGRFAGAFAVRKLGAERLLAMTALGAGALLVVAVVMAGPVGAVALLAIGLCHSVMFPLVYALAMPDEAGDAPLASMLLCMAVVGGAIVPLLTGFVADAIGLRLSLLLPGLGYGVILFFALHRAVRAREVAWS